MQSQQKESLPSQPDKNVTEGLCGDSALWNSNAALEELDNDIEVFKSLVGVLASELHERLAALQTALAAGDEELVRRTAHACKNSAGIMRLDLLRAASTEAEFADSSHLQEAAHALLNAIIEASRVLAADMNPKQVQ